MSVRVFESDEAASTRRCFDLLSSLATEVLGDQAALALRLAEDIPDNVREQLVDVTG